MNSLFRKKNTLCFILFFFGILYLTMGIANHYFYRTFTYDYGNYNFAFWDYSHFRISPLPTFKGSFLQDHFSFTLMYFIPVYWLLNWLTGTYTLIIIQNVLILVAAWFSYKLIMLKTKNQWLGIATLVYFFILHGRFTAFIADVNLAIISACFIPVFLYYFEKKNYLASFIILVLSLFSRENIPLWFVFIFFVLIIQHRKEKKAVLFSTFGIVVSILYFILLFKVFIPAIETDDKQFELFNYTALGANPAEAIKFIIQNPVESLKLLFLNHSGNPVNDGIKVEFYLVYLVSGGVILLLRPQYLIWFIPIVAQKVLNDSPTRWGIGSYYAVEIVTLLPLSVFLTLASLKSRMLQNIFSVSVCIAAFSMTIYKLDSRNVRVPWLVNPAKIKIYSRSFWEAPFDIKKVNKLLQQIPSEARVSATNNLLPHLSQRRHVYFFPNVSDAEYIVFNVHDNHYLFPHEVNEEERQKYLWSHDWEIADLEFPVFLLKHNGPAAAIDSKMKADKLFSSVDTLICNYEIVDTLNNTVFFDNNTIAGIIPFLSNEKSRSKNHSTKLTAENRVSPSVTFDDVEQIRYLQITVWVLGNPRDVHMVAADGKNLSLSGSITETDELTGWHKLSLSFWLPEKLNIDGFGVFFRNSGQNPVYFDDLQVVKYCD